MLRIALLVVLLTAVTATGSEAQPPSTDLGLVVGTEGVGVEVAQGFTRILRGRLSVSAFSASESFETDLVRYDGDADLRSAAAIVDVSPFGGTFHLSLGLVFQDHDIRGTAPIEALAIRELGAEVVGELQRLLGPLDLGELEATAELDSVAPYVGFGFRSRRDRPGVGVAFDLGAIYYGEPDVEVVARTGLPIDQVPGGQGLLDEFLEEQERELQDEVDDYEIYPVVRLSVFYRF